MTDPRELLASRGRHRRVRVVIGRLLCRLGLHRWEFREVTDADAHRTYAWCRRPGCRRGGAVFVDAEPRIRRSDSVV